MLKLMLKDIFDFLELPRVQIVAAFVAAAAIFALFLAAVAMRNPTIYPVGMIVIGLVFAPIALVKDIRKSLSI